MNLKGKMWIFGGYSSDYTKQISSVGECDLRREGTLSFHFEYGTCAVLDGNSQANEDPVGMLCFSEYSSSYYKSCYTFNGFTTGSAQSSNYPHRFTTLGKLEEG